VLADYQATVDLVCETFKRASGAGIMVTAAAGNYAKDVRGKDNAHYLAILQQCTNSSQPEK
jgi:hypothetical protein